MGDSKKYNFLFVSAPFSGIEVFMKNVNHVNCAGENVESSWIWLDRKLDFSGFSGTMMEFVNWTVKASYFTYLRIRELERSGKVFDAAFFNHVTPITFLLKFRKRIPTVLSLDSTPLLMEKYSDLYRKDTKSKLPNWILQFRYRFTRKAYVDTTIILAWSEIVKRSLINDYHIAEDHIAVVPPGVDTQRFAPVDRSARDPQNKLKILFVGGDFLRKGGDILVELARDARFRDHEFHFVTRMFTGERTSNIFIYDNISPESTQLQDLYRESDIFVLPTRADFCPTNTICEAMAMGLPVIATNVGGLDEIVKDRQTGVIVRVDDKEQLASLIHELASDRELRSRLGSNARRWVEEKFDLQKNTRAIFSHLMIAASGKRHLEEAIPHSGKRVING